MLALWTLGVPSNPTTGERARTTRLAGVSTSHRRSPRRKSTYALPWMEPANPGGGHDAKAEQSLVDALRPVLEQTACNVSNGKRSLPTLLFEGHVQRGARSSGNRGNG